jgi:hypothetical protein
MFKFLLIVGLILYVIYKIGTLFFRAGAASQQFRNPNRNQNFNQPNNQQEKKGKNFKGGEYVDYEEIK